MSPGPDSSTPLAPPTQDATHTPPAPAALFSCDVFDTAITRLVGAPVSVFLLLARRLAARGHITLSPEAFVAARRDAEARAVGHAGPACSLQRIYHEMQFGLGWDDELRDLVMQEELRLELELIRPVPGVHERLAAARRSGMKVVFLSDMYLESGFVRSMLEAHGICASGDSCYVSSETGATKETGAAFVRLADVERVPPARIVHRGNDTFADVTGARRAGAVPEPCPEVNPNRYEQTLERWAAATEGLASVFAGASRMARLSVPAASEHERNLRDVAAGVGAPAIAGFVLWVLHEARRRGLRRLYFLARDGWILREVAERLNQRLQFGIEIRYLHGGRRAWYKPSVTDTERGDIFWGIDHSPDAVTVRSFLERLDLDPEALEPVLDAAGHPRPTWDRVVPPHDYDALWSLARVPAIRGRILGDAAERRARVLAYARQEGILEHDAWAAVDVGWSGRAVGAFDRALHTVGGSVPVVFFIARVEDRKSYSIAPLMPIHTWLVDQTRGLGHGRDAHEEFFELFCGAPHGATVDFVEDDEGLKPVFAMPDNPALMSWGLPLVHQTILAFVDNLWLDTEAVDVAADTRPAVARLMEMFVHAPTPGEAQAWGAYPFEHGSDGVVRRTLATPYRLRHLPHALMNGWIAHSVHREWRHAGMVLTPTPTRVLLRAAMKLRNTAGPIAKRVLIKLGLRR